MASSTEPSRPSRHDTPVSDETFITDLRVEGALPVGLSGRLLHIGPNPIGPPADHSDAMVHAVHLHQGRAVSYRNRWITTDATARKLGVEPAPGPRHFGPDTAADNLIRFASSTFALGDRSIAYELSPTVQTVRRVDLAGKSRGLAPYPKLDITTGELHLLAAGTSQTHVVVSPGGLTRTNRPVADLPGRATDLAITHTHLVVAGEGFIGLAPRAGNADVAWFATGAGAPRLINAYDDGSNVVVYALTPAIERWTLHIGKAMVDRVVLNPTSQLFARSNERLLGTPPRHIWSVADAAAHKHEVFTGRRETHAFEPGCQPGDLVFVADPVRSNDEDGGWLIGFLHHDNGSEHSLIVIDAADFARPPVAAVRIPRRVPEGRNALWIPSAL